MRTVSLTGPDQAQRHRAVTAGLQWEALSDDEEAAGAGVMDGYTSSDDSYGGHMGGFAFEGAVSEAADPDDDELARYLMNTHALMSVRMSVFTRVHRLDA